MKDPYVDENGVLLNKLGIKDSDTLNEAETAITTAKITSIKDVEGDFDFEHLKAMHQHIFGDIYEWAGKERTIPVEKAEAVLQGMSVSYSAPKNIAKDATEAIKSLNNTDWSKLNTDEKAEYLTCDVAKLWQAHAFREGNTRTTITFACELAEAKGFPMDRELLAKNSGYVRKALVMASIGEYSEPEHLKRILKDSIERGAVLAKDKGAEQGAETEPRNEKRRNSVERD